MRKLILLNKDGSITKRDETKITGMDLDFAKFLLISTEVSNSRPSRNYILIESSPLLLFGKAAIHYQMTACSYLDGGDAWDEHLLKPILVETDSITRVFTLINCLDRLNCVNNLLTGDLRTNAGENIHIDISYFEVLLYDKKGKEIFHKYYESSPNSKEYYFSFGITNKFRKIYNSDIIPNMAKNSKYLFLNQNETWEITDGSRKNGLIGVPLVQSNTITFCNDMEMERLSSYIFMDFTCTVADVTKEMKKTIGLVIRTGDYDKLESIGISMDYFAISNGAYYLVDWKKYVHLDFLSHMEFIISIINLVWDEVNREYNFCTDCIISFNFREGKRKEREIYFNEGSLLSLHQILNII